MVREHRSRGGNSAILTDHCSGWQGIRSADPMLHLERNAHGLVFGEHKILRAESDQLYSPHARQQSLPSATENT
jgi:hypothetical protein